MGWAESLSREQHAQCQCCRLGTTPRLCNRSMHDSGWRLFGRQCRGLLTKNVLTRVRSWQLNALQLLSAVLIVFLIWACDKAVSYSNSQFTGAQAQQDPPRTRIGPIPDCRADRFIQKDKPCFSLLYSPVGASLPDQVMRNVALNNDPPLPLQLVRGFKTQQQIDDYLLDNPATAMAAVHFRQITPQTWSYVLQINDSVVYFKGQFQDPNKYLQLPVQAAVEREFARLTLQDATLPWEIAITDFPHPSLTTSSIVGRVAPVFLLATLMIHVVLFMQAVVGEKEVGLRAAMTSMGLMDSAYWTSLLAVEALLAAVNAALLTALCIVFRFDLATRNSPALLFLLLFLSALALSAGGLILSSLLRKVSYVVPTALVVFIIAWVFMLVLTFGFPYNGSTDPGLVVLFSLFPWSLLSKGLLDLAAATTGTKAGISWDNRASYCWASNPSAQKQAELPYWQSDCSMPLNTAFKVLVIQVCVYTVLGLYLDGVVAATPGAATKHWLFPLLPSTWWTPKKESAATAKHAKKALAAALAPESHPAPAQPVSRADGTDSAKGSADHDVEAEEQRVQRVCQAWCASQTPGSPPAARPTTDTCPFSPTTGVFLMGLHKVFWKPLLSSCATWVAQHANLPALERFWSILLRPRKWRKYWRQEHQAWQAANRLVAVQPTWLHLAPGECFCLLGPNGAGKTTTINCLLGSVHPSRGDALVWGHSVRSVAGLAAIRHTTGVCPQFDILWPELTAEEHLRLFHDIKGVQVVSKATTEASIQQMLSQVSLSKAAKRRAGAFSGGMRRRLSLAIALLGDPLLLVLDEPTTGLDPVSRREVWSLLSEVKKGRCLLLTTHYMEEADVLGDRIGIFVRGGLQCLGSGLRLKSKFGDGLRLSVGLDPSAGTDTTAGLQGPSSEWVQLAEVAAKVSKVVLQDSSRMLGTESTQDSGSVVAVAPERGVGAVPEPVGGVLAERVQAVRDIVNTGLDAVRGGVRCTEPPCQQRRQGVAGAAHLPDAVQDADTASSVGGATATVATVGHSDTMANGGGSSEPAAAAGEGTDSPSVPAGSQQPVAVAQATGVSRTGLHYAHFIIPHTKEDVLPGVLSALQNAGSTLGVCDVQVGLTSLEEVFLSVVDRAGGGAAR